MKYLHRLTGILMAFCLMIVLFITSIEAVVYWTPGYFEKEYTKYEVLKDLPAMTMKDLLEVTDEMMDYLRGDREDLHVMTVICLGTGLFFGLIAALAAIISTDFTKYFIMFHHIFFSNDLWILDPSTDMLINIVPEGFFMDTAGRIAFTFGSLSLILFAVCLALTLKHKHRP